MSAGAEGATAREYLKGRGLDAEMIDRFRIGYAPDSGFLLRDALRREFDEELLRESGLFSWKEGTQQSAVSHCRSLAPLGMTRTVGVPLGMTILLSSRLVARSPQPSIPNSAIA